MSPKRRRARAPAKADNPRQRPLVRIAIDAEAAVTDAARRFNRRLLDDNKCRAGKRQRDQVLEMPVIGRAVFSAVLAHWRHRNAIGKDDAAEVHRFEQATRSLHQGDHIIAAASAVKWRSCAGARRRTGHHQLREIEHTTFGEGGSAEADRVVDRPGKPAVDRALGTLPALRRADPAGQRRCGGSAAANSPRKPPPCMARSRPPIGRWKVPAADRDQTSIGRVNVLRSTPCPAKNAEILDFLRGRFARLDDRFDRIDHKLDEVITRLGIVERDVAGVKMDFTAMNLRLDTSAAGSTASSTGSSWPTTPFPARPDHRLSSPKSSTGRPRPSCT